MCMKVLSNQVEGFGKCFRCLGRALAGSKSTPGQPGKQYSLFMIGTNTSEYLNTEWTNKNIK